MPDIRCTGRWANSGPVITTGPALLLRAWLAFITFQAGCARAGAPPGKVKSYQYHVPQRLNDGWEPASLGAVGLNAKLIRELFERVGDNSYKNIHTVLLVKNGKLVVEEYFSGRNGEGQYQTITRVTLQEMHSATKSVNSILVGIAIDQHLIRGVDESVSIFFPEYSDIITNRQKAVWGKAPNGVVNTLGGLSLRPRDMAKIGCLFLDGGRWQGRQIVSEKWVKESTHQQAGAGQLPAWFLADGYGYQWWLGSFPVRGQLLKSFSARGRGGQFIIIFPSLEMVAVFTGWNDNELMGQPLEMLQRYVIPAAMPDTAKPAN